jgi:hypothetical protein
MKTVVVNQYDVYCGGGGRRGGRVMKKTAAAAWRKAATAAARLKEAMAAWRKAAAVDAEVKEYKQADSGVGRDCFICCKKLEQDFPLHPHNPLHSNWIGATDWTTIGNWCSQVHDGMLDSDGDTLHIVMCDQCVKERLNRAIKIKYTDYN